MNTPLKILYVDDHIALCQSLAQALQMKQTNFQVLTAFDFDEAIRVFTQNHDIKIVLLDLNLDSRCGFDLIPKFKQINESVKIIIYTMFYDPLHIEQALHFGVEGYITKAATMEKILKTIISVSEGNMCYNRETKSVMQTLVNSSNVWEGGG